MPVRRGRAAVPTVNLPFHREPAFAHISVLSDNNITSVANGNVKTKKFLFFNLNFVGILSLCSWI